MAVVRRENEATRSVKSQTISSLADSVFEWRPDGRKSKTDISRDNMHEKRNSQIVCI